MSAVTKFLGVLGLAAVFPITYKVIDYLPEPEDSLKHKLRHKLGMAHGSVTHCTTTNGHRRMGLRCCICGVMMCIDGETEDPIRSREEPHERSSRLVRKEWYNRWGPKDHDSYLLWLHNRDSASVRPNE